MLQVDLPWLPRATQACERAVLLPKSETDLATGPLPSHHDVRALREREIRAHAEDELKEKLHPGRVNHYGRCAALRFSATWFDIICLMKTPGQTTTNREPSPGVNAGKEWN